MITYALVAIMALGSSNHAYVMDSDMSFTDCLSKAIELNSTAKANNVTGDFVAFCEGTEIPLILADETPNKIIHTSKDF